MRPLLKAIDTTSEWTGKIVSFFIYIGIGVLVFEVLMRYAFNAPTIWAHGVSMRFFAVYYILLGAYTFYKQAHVRVDVVYNRLSLRGRAILDVATASLLFASCIALIWYGIPYTAKSFALLETDNTPFHAPMYPIKLMIPLGAFLLLLQGLAKFYRDLVTAITGRRCEY